MWTWIILGCLLAVVAAVLIAGRLAPRRTVRFFFKPLLIALYRKRVIGLENLPREGGYVIAANHVSWVDGILILWMMPRNVRFIVDGGNFHSRVLNYLAAAFQTILMTANPKSIARALKAAREGLAAGDVIGIFPEGTLTRSGHLQGFRPGISKVLRDRTGPVVPVWVEGMWGSIFSHSGGKLFWKRPSLPRRPVTMHIGKPLPADSSLGRIRTELQALGAEAAITARDRLPTLPRRIIRGWKRRGGGLQAADSLGNEAGGRSLLMRTLILRRLLRREVLQKGEQHVGLLLPPSVAGVATNVALAFDRRVSVNLNYTVSSEVLNHCLKTAGIRHVLSSEKFLEKFDFQLDAEIVPLETLRNKVTTLDKLVGWVAAYVLPAGCLEALLGLGRIDPDDPLTVIFTSGSTGMPKGVTLSHANVSHNVQAIDQAVHLTTEDVVLGILPFFHSFGYTVTLWAAQTLGPCGVYHFNPLDARQVGKLAHRYGATVLLGTPTFLRGYLRRIEPEQFAELDVVVVGAEKMPADLFEAFETRFGVRPVEGYGTTELSPLVSVNIPPTRSVAKYQPDRVEGSVGRPVPGVAARIISSEEERLLDTYEDGMLLVRGPNVMQGYLGRPDLTAEALRDGWYVTGDIAHVDDAGFLHITGRLSRFSKIGGEMVPHVRVEEALIELLQEGTQDDQLRVCVTAVPDTKKGERLIVLHLPTTRSVDELRAGLREVDLPNLFIPATDAFYQVDEIPVLGTGKLDLKRTRELAETLAGAAPPQRPSETSGS